MHHFTHSCYQRNSHMSQSPLLTVHFFFFFFNDPAPTEFSPLPLHDAFPISANPHTVVVIKSGSAVLMPWVDQAPAILEAWYPGEEDGNAVADVLFGDYNPSGKLPMTFPKNRSEEHTSELQSQSNLVCRLLLE